MRWLLKNELIYRTGSIFLHYCVIIPFVLRIYNYRYGLPDCEIYSIMHLATNSAIFTGTALPMACSIFVLLPTRMKSFGNVCNRLLSLVVSALTPAEMSVLSAGCFLYVFGIGRLTPLIVELGSCMLKTALLL